MFASLFTCKGKMAEFSVPTIFVNEFLHGLVEKKETNWFAITDLGTPHVLPCKEVGA